MNIREIIYLESENEERVLYELVKNADKKLIDISEDLKIPVKTVVSLKKSLEAKYIIRTYSAIFNHVKLEIKRKIIFLKFTSEGVRKMDKFSEFAKRNKNIIKLMIFNISDISPIDVAVSWLCIGLCCALLC